MISSPHRRTTFAGSVNQGVTVFPITFRFFQASHLKVTLVDATGVSTVYTLDVQYSVSGAGNQAGGTVILLGATLAVDETLIVERVVPAIQEIDLTNQGEVFPQTMEDGLDYQTMLAQQADAYLGISDDTLTRVLKLFDGHVDGAGSYNARGNAIDNMADGADPQSAVTVSQLSAALAGVVSGSGGNARIIVGTSVGIALPAPGLAFDYFTTGLEYCVRDTGLPDVVKRCHRQSDGVTYEWFAVSMATA